MQTILIILQISILWAILSLLVQFLSSWNSKKKDFSQKVGNPIKAVIYNFTWAMTPKHKETIRLHPFKFSLGIVMHIGVFGALLKVLHLIVMPSSPSLFPFVLSPVFALSALAALLLLIGRINSSKMRYFSSAEDYISNLITFGLVSLAFLHEQGIFSSASFLIYSSIFFFYLPLGKLRHALFFFTARFNYAWRLGIRGVYPTRKI